MFHSSTLSPRSPLTNPREKYLAALAEAKAAEAEYLAAERLQQEEDSLRQRLEQIQLLKHNTPRSDLGSYYAPAQYPQSVPLDIDLLRRQIAAEEGARITREQQQAHELEAFRKQQAIDFEKQQARELEALRIHEARKAQLARDNERTRSLAAQRARLAALTQQVSEPAVRFVISGDSAPARRNHIRFPVHSLSRGSNILQCCPHYARRPEFHNTVDLTPYLAAAPRAVDPNEAFQTLFNAQKEAKPESTLNPQDFLHLLFGGRAEERSKTPTPKASTQAQQPALHPEDFLKLLFGGRVEERSKAPAPSPAPAAAPKADTKPQQPAKGTAPQVVTLEQLINHFLGAVGVEQAQPSTSTASPPQEPKARPSEKKEAAPAPAPAPKPAATSSAPQAVGLEHILSQFLGGAGAQSGDFQQLKNMFMGGHAQTPKVPEASSSKSASSSVDSPLKAELESRLRSQQSSEERDLEEAIRMSLAEATTNPTPASPSEAKGKAPAPAPVKDVTTSTAEVTAIDAAFTALAADFAFPATLDFSTSRASSPTRASSESSGGAVAVARLSYSAQNQGVRVYHQALSGLLGRLDAVESFGDERLRYARKEVVGRVEGALDELEQVIEARWRKFAGREERVESAPTPVESAPVAVESAPVATEAAAAPVPVEASPSAEEETPAVVAAEDAQEHEIEVVDLKTDVEENPTPAAESSYPPTVDSSATATSYPPAAESSSYPPAIADSASVETPSPSPSPTPSDVDTFLLPATSDSDEVPQKKIKRSEEEEVGSDWSEVDA